MKDRGIQNCWRKGQLNFPGHSTQEGQESVTSTDKVDAPEGVDAAEWEEYVAIDDCIQTGSVMDDDDIIQPVQHEMGKEEEEDRDEKDNQSKCCYIQLILCSKKLVHNKNVVISILLLYLVLLEVGTTVSEW